MPKSHSPRKRTAKKRRAIVLATPEGKIQFADRTARRWLHQFFGRADSAGLLPRKICRWLKGDQETGIPTCIVANYGRAHLFLKRERISTAQNTVLVLELIGGKAHERLRRQRDLTRREDEVMSWLEGGKANHEIAAILGIAPATVSKHLERAYPKLGVENRTAASNLHRQGNPHKAFATAPCGVDSAC